MSLTSESIAKLEDLFNEKGWPIESDAKLYSSLFNRFCNRLSLFEEANQNLLIELAKEFINVEDFSTCFIDSMNTIPDLPSYRNIFFHQLKKISEKNTKSADYLFYHLKNYTDFSYESYHGKFHFVNSLEQTIPALKNDQLVILIDDFIGTGQTAVDVLDELFSKKIIRSVNNIKIVSLAAQRQGINNISHFYGEIAHSALILGRGISDKYEGRTKLKNLNLMDNMESKIKVKDDFRRGYGRSESLIAFQKKAPNNTFPVFWLEDTISIAPFKNRKF